MFSKKIFKGRVMRFIPAVIGATMVVTGLSATTQAHAAEGPLPGAYSISATPTTVQAGSTTTYSVTITNQSPPESVDVLNAASFTLPAGFSNVSVTPPPGWNASSAGNTVSISAAAPNVGLLPEQSVTVQVSAKAPTGPGNYTWSSSASGLVGGFVASEFSREGDEPSTMVATFVGFCPALTACTSPTQSSNGTTAKVRTESGANDDIYTLSLHTPVGDQCGKAVSGNQSTFTNEDLTRYLTVTMTLASYKRIYHKSYGICFANKTPFQSKYGWVATAGSDGFYHGYLASCTTTGNVKPCLVSLTDNCGTLTAVFRSPPGDPRGMFGIL